MPSFLERKLAGALVPGGHRPALGLRCRWATSHRDVAAPKGGAKYVRYQKLAQSQVSPPPLGEVPPCGGRRGQPASAPHNPVSPRRRLYQRAVHAWGGWTGKLGGNLRGIEDAIKKPPARVSYGKQSTGLFSYFPALADATKTLGALPPIPPPPLKRWTKLLPAYGAHAS